MADSDDETLAPVTYLFGARAPREATEAASSSSERDRPTPAFRDESPPATGHPAGALRASEPDAASDGTSAASAPSVEELSARMAEIVAEPPQAIKREGKFDRISNVSMHALGRKGISTLEMRDYLLGRDFDEHEVEVELDRLISVQLLDDCQLAEALLRTLRERKGLGRTAIASELRRRKLSTMVIEEVMIELGDDELDRATELAVKRAPQLRSLDAETAKRRLSGFLMRKGYSGSVVSAAVSEALRPGGSSSGGPVFR